MANAPYQLWVDCPAPLSAVRSSNVLTVTFPSAHSLVVGSVVQIGDTANLSGVSGVYTVASVPSSTSFTVASSGANGTAKVTGTAGTADGYAFVAQDLLNPLINYSAAARPNALYVPTESISMSSSGDGVGVTMSFKVMQDDTPAVGPWNLLIPDDARVRLVKLETMTEPTEAATIMLGMVSSFRSLMTGSGQGTETDVNVVDNNAVLDRLIVVGRAPTPTYASLLQRIGGTVTVTTPISSYLSPGKAFKVSNAIGGGTQSFNGDFVVATAPSGMEFTYVQAGSNASVREGFTNIPFTNVKRKGTSGTNARVLVCTTSNTIRHGIVSGQTIEIQGFTAGTQNDRNYINNSHTGAAVKVISATVFEINIGVALSAINESSSAAGYLYATYGALITPADQQVPAIGLTGGETEDSAVQKIMGWVKYRYADADIEKPLFRLINLQDVSKIVGGSTPNSTGVTFPAGTLRSCLDSVIEMFGGQDKKLRRYWVNPQRQLNYALTDPASVPTYATAPYKIITSGIQDPNTSTAAATLYVNDIQVEWTHNTTKAIFMSGSAQDNTVITPQRTQYTSAGYTNRPGGVIFEDIAEAPTASVGTAMMGVIQKLSSAYLLERHKPVLSGSFTVRGRGTQTWNQYGYANGGYGLNSSGSPVLVTSWAPGQWVDITAPEFALSGLYRIEQVTWGLEPGTFQSYATITFNRRPPQILTALLSGKGM